MSDEGRAVPEDDHEKLEEELAEVRAKEDLLERELERAKEDEKEIEREISQEHTHHRGGFHLIFIINGEDFRVHTHPEALLRTAVEKALEESGNTGRRNPSEWEVRNSAGVLLEMGRDIRALGLHDGSRLFLSLKVGAGGCRCD